MEVDRRGYRVALVAQFDQALLTRGEQGGTDPREFLEVGLAVGRHGQLAGGVVFEANVVGQRHQHAFDVEAVVGVDIGFDEGTVVVGGHAMDPQAAAGAWRSRRKSMNTRSLRGMFTRLG